MEKTIHNYDKILKKIDRLSQLINTNLSSKRWLRTKEAAEYLGVSESQIHYLRANGVLKNTKLSGTNYYDRYQIDEILSEGEDE